MRGNDTRTSGGKIHEIVFGESSDAQNCRKPMNILIGGTRTFKNYGFFKKKVNKITKKIKDITIITGGREGVDGMAVRWAHENRRTCIIEHPDWDTHGKRAGPVRNYKMVKRADAAIFFWDGKSRGTADTIRKAEKKELRQIRIIEI